MNPMKEIKLEKITINLGAGESGPRLDRSRMLLKKITNKKTVTTITHKRTLFGMAKRKPIGVKVTLRGNEGKELLATLLKAVDNRLKPSQFDSSGNFSFGIHECINIPKFKYDPEIGILGMDVCVTLERPGFRVKKRLIKPGKIPNKHRITKEESMQFAKKEFDVTISEGEEE